MAVRLSGKMVGIRVDRHEVFIALDNDPKAGPKGNEFSLNKESHENYNALYALALAAAANRWPVTIRIEGGGVIDSAAEAGIRTLAVGSDAF